MADRLPPPPPPAPSHAHASGQPSNNSNATPPNTEPTTHLHTQRLHAVTHLHLHDDTHTPVNHNPTTTNDHGTPPALPLDDHTHHAPGQGQGQSANANAPVPTIRFIPYITDTHRGLNFPIIERKLPNGKLLRVKRFVEKGNVDLSDAIAFKSKVVSRQHGELWTEGMSFFYRDTKSSSGTFINNVRVSPANTESQPVQLKDGDIIQLGVDYQGRTEDIFRCVRMRVELNREAFKHRNNAFRNQVIRALRALAAASDKDSTGTGDCCICLGAIAPFQALFIAPCCHSFHFKCARPLLQGWPNFNCPLCRHFADLSVSVSIEDLSMLVIDDGGTSPGAVDADDHAPLATSTSPTSPPTARHDNDHPAALGAVAAPAPTSSRTSHLLEPTAGGVQFTVNAATIERSHSNATPPLPSTGSGILAVLPPGSPALLLSGPTAPSSADARHDQGAVTPVTTGDTPGGAPAATRGIPGAFPVTPALGNTPTLGVPMVPPALATSSSSSSAVATPVGAPAIGSTASVASTAQHASPPGSVSGSRDSNVVDAHATDAEVARVTQALPGAESTSTRSSEENVARQVEHEEAAAARAMSATPTASAGKPQGPELGGEVPPSAGSSSGSPVLGGVPVPTGQELVVPPGGDGTHAGSGVVTPVRPADATAR